MSDPPVDPDEFRRCMGRWPTGVAIVTGRSEGADVGLTVNAFLSVSLAPPSVLVSLHRAADSTPVIERTGRFAASLLAADQRAISERFARAVTAQEKFHGLPVARSPEGLAVIPGSIGRMACEVRAVYPALDHRLVLGEVRWMDLPSEDRPLVFARSGYASTGPDGSLRLPEPRRA